MSVCSRVNMQLLHKCFDLGPFHGLCTPHPDDVLQPLEEQSVKGNQDAELSTSNHSSPKIVEEPWEPVSPQAMEGTQGRITEEATAEELLSAVHSGNS
ncbi:unnamed protein product, partial [Gulo gulo]